MEVEDVSKIETMSDKKIGLISILTDQMLEAELTWNAFWSTCEHYKIDSLLRPFPKMYTERCGDKMINELRLTMQSVGKLNEVLEELKAGTLREDVVELLNWVLRSEAFKLRALARNEFPGVLGKVQDIKDIVNGPRYIFEVDTREKASYRRFKALAEQHGSRFAFHGSRLENYFSILHNGLQIIMNKVAAFGRGVYLSSDLSVSLVFSPSGMGCPGSVFGDCFAMVALCEIVDHPDVKCQHDKDSTRKYASRRRSTQVPNKYFIVQNSDMIQVRYLLVYPGFSQSAIQKRLSSLPVKFLGVVLSALFIILYNSQFLIRFLRKVLKLFITNDF